MIARPTNTSLKKNYLKGANLDDLVACYHAENRHECTEGARLKCIAHDELIKRDRVNLILEINGESFWLVTSKKKPNAILTQSSPMQIYQPRERHQN